MVLSDAEKIPTSYQWKVLIFFYKIGKVCHIWSQERKGTSNICIHRKIYLKANEDFSWFLIMSLYLLKNMLTCFKAEYKHYYDVKKGHTVVDEVFQETK